MDCHAWPRGNPAPASAIERDINDPGPFCHSYESDNGRGCFPGNLRVWQNDPAFRDYCFDSALPRITTAFFGSSKINLLYDPDELQDGAALDGSVCPLVWDSAV